ncbi:hypothetical protein [Natronococcus wangiae]|uniref:hypothetical protein n=1 Tax=Natronococcus wangiae TaxID=3068275 RepID=UPI00273DBD4C|nr:hypothetical protein [Natronococcus sp. AD5]
MNYESSIGPPCERLGDRERYGWAALSRDRAYNEVLHFARATETTLELATVEEGAELPRRDHPSEIGEIGEENRRER